VIELPTFLVRRENLAGFARVILQRACSFQCEARRFCFERRGATRRVVSRFGKERPSAGAVYSFHRWPAQISGWASVSGPSRDPINFISSAGNGSAARMYSPRHLLVGDPVR
jgi:hypothetical protein